MAAPMSTRADCILPSLTVSSRFYAGKRVNGDGGAAIGHAVVIQELAHAADAVAAHFFPPSRRR